MKILMTAHDFHPNIGGVSTVVGLLAESFTRSGHQVTVATLAPGPTFDYGYRVLRNPGPLALCRLYASADLIILSNLSLKLIYPLLLIDRAVALQHHSESAFALSRSWFSADLLRRYVMARATHFTCSDFVGRRSGFTRYQVASPPVASRVAESSLAPLAERRHALFVGRLVPEKGILWLVERWPTVRRELGVDELRIVGSGPLDVVLAEQCARDSSIRLLGALAPTKTALEMAGARYLLVPSLWEEPFGAVALEGIEAGALTVLSCRGGLPEAGGELGFYFQPDDEPSFVAALGAARATFEQLHSDRAAAEHWRAKARHHLERFRPEVIAGQLLSRAPAARRLPATARD